MDNYKPLNNPPTIHTDSGICSPASIQINMRNQIGGSMKNRSRYVCTYQARIWFKKGKVVCIKLGYRGVRSTQSITGMCVRKKIR